MLNRRIWTAASLLAALTSASCAIDPASESASALASVSCAGKADGFYCDGSNLVTCTGGIRSKSVGCASGCLPGMAIGDDRCAGDLCSGAPDGAYCVPEEQAVYTCAAERTSDRTACVLGCANDQPPGHDHCHGCGVGQILCGGTCLNGATDIQNCGACGNVCHDGAHGTATCALGRCALDCKGDFKDCDGNLSNGCEAKLATDRANCGACGRTCAAGLSCVSGACTSHQRLTFDRLPDGTPVTSDRILKGDEFLSQGVEIAGAPEDSYCAEGTRSAIRVHAYGLSANILTTASSSSSNPAMCNGVPIALSFKNPVRHVSLTFNGASVTYVLKVFDAHGTLIATVPKAAVRGDTAFTVSYDSPTANIARVTFGFTRAITAVTAIDYE